MPYPSRQRCENASSSAKSALYTQFCIGVELGDDALVRDLVVRGADTMVSYGVDGVITTPIHSALSKGDVPMTLALLTSRSTRVRLADLDSAPRIKKELMTPLLVQRLSIALEDGAKDLLLRRTAPTSSRSRAKLSLSESVADHLRSRAGLSEDSDTSSTLRASPTDKPRCPPKELIEQIDAEPVEMSGDEEEDEEDDLDSEADEEAEVGSMVSSAGESSVDADDS